MTSKKKSSPSVTRIEKIKGTPQASTKVPVRKFAAPGSKATAERVKSAEGAVQKNSEVAQRIVECRKLQHLSMRALASKAGLSHSTLHRIETNPDQAIPLKDVIRIAQALGVPVTRLVNGSPVRDRVLTAARAGTQAAATGVINKVIEILEIEDQLNEINIPNRQVRRYQSIARVDQTPSEWGKMVAQEIRTLWDLPTGPLRDLPTLIELKTGIYVTIEEMLEGVDGVSLGDPVSGTTLIAVSTTTLWERQRFTLAHELGHVIAGQMKIETFATQSRSDDEKAADEFARNLLLPWADVVKKNFERGGAPWGPGDVAALAWEYQVSPKVAAIQLSRCGFIDDSMVSEVSIIPSESWSILCGWDQERAGAISESSTPRKPSGLTDRILQGWAAGLLPITLLARVSNVDVEELTRLVAPLKLQSTYTAE